jgi:hypothetical protein
MLDVVPIMPAAYLVTVTNIREGSKLFSAKMSRIAIRLAIFVSEATSRRISYFLPYRNLPEFIS